VVLVCGGVSPDAALPLLLKAVELGMAGPNYVYILPYFVMVSLSPWEPWLTKPNITDAENQLFRQAYRHAIVVNAVMLLIY